MESSSLAPSTPKRLSDTDENGTRCHKRQKAEDCVACLSNQGSFGLQEAQNAIVSMDIGIDGPTAEYEQSNKLQILPQESHMQTLLPLSGQFMGHGNRSTGSGNGNTTSEKSLCFGLLRNIPILINSNQYKQPITFDELGRDDKTFALLELDIETDRCVILARGTPIATMNTKTHFALKSLQNKENLKYTGLIPRPEFLQKLSAAAEPLRSSSTKLSCQMGILIFGPRWVADTLAKDLSHYHLFLQHPDYRPDDAVYYNPQYLALPGSSFANGAILPPIVTDSLQIDRDQSVKLRHDALPDLETVMDNLPQPSHLNEAEIDHKIRTTLLRHQREAVDFIMKRESGDNDFTNSRSLWHQENRNSKPEIYRHIAGSPDPIPQGILGGILADDMGLGKTLAIISSIVASLPHLNGFADKTHLAHTKSTLVIVPSVLLIDGWIDEIEKHVMPGTLTYYKYHGTNRILSRSEPLPDVVLSTYDTVAADMRQGGGVINYFHWHRIVLDEAHYIRNSSTKMFKVVTSLRASIRWCVTGTPIQNSLDDLASLIKFLRYPLLEDTRTFRKYMYVAKKTEAIGKAKKPNYENLKLLLGQICLRRSTLAILTSLKCSFIEIRPCFSEKERTDYKKLAISCCRAIKACLTSRSTDGGNKSVLTALLRLRIFCNTGVNDTGDNFMPDENISLLQQGSEAMCTECNADMLFSDAVDSNESQERHQFRFKKCHKCARWDIRSGNTENVSRDPQDLKDLGIDESISHTSTNMEHHSTLNHSVPEPSIYPSKLRALLDDVKEHYSRDKSIIFSFWRRSLDLVGDIFQSESVVFGRVDGNMKPSERKNVIDQFCNGTSMQVLLMTLGTGSEGLNGLSVASRVHILEPQWNPAVEKQAMGRIIRLNQTRPIHVIRYIVANTIEENIETGQMRKMQLSWKGGLQGSTQELSESKRRIAHLQALGKIIDPEVSNQRTAC